MNSQDQEKLFSGPAILTSTPTPVAVKAMEPRVVISPRPVYIFHIHAVNPAAPSNCHEHPALPYPILYSTLIKQTIIPNFPPMGYLSYDTPQDQESPLSHPANKYSSNIE